MDATPPPLKASQIVAVFVSLSCISVLAQILVVRVRLPLLWDIVRGRETNWARICGVIVFVLSWVFTFAMAMLVLGVGLPGHLGICWNLTILCVIFYATTKVFTYLILTEKVYLVWAACSNSRRPRSIVWWTCMCAILLYICCFIVVLAERWARLDEAGDCLIGLKLPTTAATWAFDVLLTVGMTFLFIYRLRRNASVNARLKKAAYRALIASTICLTSCTINFIVFMAIPGGVTWICTLCVTDVTVNAISIYYVTFGNDSAPINTQRASTTFARQHTSTLMIPTGSHSVNTSSVPDGYDVEKYLLKDPACRGDEASKPEYWTTYNRVQEIPSPVPLVLSTSPRESTSSRTPTHDPAPTKGNLESWSSSSTR